MKAIIQNGSIRLPDPLPAGWSDGMEVDVRRFDDRAIDDDPFVDSSSTVASETSGKHPVDVWMDEVERLAALGNPEDDARLMAALDEIREQGKAIARQQARRES